MGMLRYTKQNKTQRPKACKQPSVIQDLNPGSSFEDPYPPPPIPYDPSLPLDTYSPPVPRVPELLGRFPTSKKVRPSKEPGVITQTLNQMKSSKRQAELWRAYVDKQGALLNNYQLSPHPYHRSSNISSRHTDSPTGESL